MLTPVIKINNKDQVSPLHKFMGSMMDGVLSKATLSKSNFEIV